MPEFQKKTVVIYVGEGHLSEVCRYIKLNLFSSGSPCTIPENRHRYSSLLMKNKEKKTCKICRQNTLSNDSEDEATSRPTVMIQRP